MKENISRSSIFRSKMKLEANKREETSILKNEIDANISDILRRQELATEILKEPISKESQEEIKRNVNNIRPYLEEDIEL